jgi:hypothetical protein
MQGPHGEMAFYEGDPSRLTDEQQRKLADLMSSLFNIGRTQVAKDLLNGTLPIKAEGCVVSICQIHALCMM